MQSDVDWFVIEWPIDTKSPELYLYGPVNNTLNTTSNWINFTFNATDVNTGNFGIDNCTLWINNIVNRTETNPLDDITKIQNITTYLPNNDYMWKIDCKDSYNNINTSESRNISIDVSAGNDAPTQARNLSIQVGTSTIVNETTATNKYMLSTHDFTPIINWTNGTDSNGDQIDMFVCILSDATTDTCDVYGVWTNQSNLTNFPGLNHSGRWYVNITTNDGTVNGTTYSTNFTINNTLPLVSAVTILNGNDTHDNTPLINWTVIDPDAGGNYQWPADTQVDYIVIGNVSGEGVYYNKTDGTANNNSETVTSILPWNTTRDDWTANRTYYVTMWAGDGSETNGTRNSTTLRLYDNLINITQIWMADDGTLEDCSLAAGSQCSLQAVSHSNVSNLIFNISGTDIDNDCDATGLNATVWLCNRTSGVCNENNYDFKFTLNKTLRTGSICSYNYTYPIGPAFTPAFYVPGSTNYLMHVNISSQAGQALGSIKEGNDNATWHYKNVTSVNFTGVISMGDGTVNANVWNNGTIEYNMTNWGNVILNLTWNITNMSGPGSEGWEMNGTDLRIDDDPNAQDDAGNLTARGLNATNYTFVYSSGLRLCTSYACTGGMVNNVSLPTHWHIYPPSGLTAGTYYGNITYRIFAV